MKKEKVIIPKELANLLIQLRKIKGEKEAVSKRLSDINGQEEYCEQLILSKMMQEGLQKATVAGAGTASIKHDIYPVIKNWDKCIQWIMKHKEFSLLQKRLSSTAWREISDAGIAVLGVEQFEKDTILFRRGA